MIPAAGTVVAHRFRLIRPLADENMGSVWLADHLSLEVKCAVKLMGRAALSDATSRARFQLEAKSIAQLQSPHIVRVLDYDGHDETPFIAMELLEGEDLSQRLARLGRLDATATHRIVADIAQGLSKAHAAGIVHRDLKPGNIFLARTDQGEVAKLLDFGIAKVTFGAVHTGTLAGTVLGTPQYMSPEQVRGSPDIDYRSDLWSLAVVAYECLLGRLPFDSPALGSVFAQILVDEIPVPRRRAPEVGLPAGFDRWWARAASRDPEARFASAKELAEALAQALGLREQGERDATPLPSPVSSTISGEAIDLPVRSRWRMPVFVVAAATAVASLAMVGLARSDHGDAAAAVDPRAARAAATAPAPSPDAPPRAAASTAALAPPGASSEADHPASPGEERAVAPPASARALPRGPAPRTWAPPHPRAAASKPHPLPTDDDVDFGI